MLHHFLHIYNWFNYKPQQRLGIRNLQIVLGVVFLIRAFTELPFANYLYGSNGIAANPPYNLMYGDTVAGFVEHIFQFNGVVHILLLILAVCGICYIVNFKTRLITLLSLIIFNIINTRNFLLGDGGDNITQLILVYMLLLLPIEKKAKEGSLRVWFHNLGVVAIAAQIMILYFTAGFMKINGEAWVNGTAMYNLSQVEAFSLPAIRDVFKNPYITTIASYTTMIFLTWFPIAMFSKVKLLWIFLGVSFHLGILGFMGLATFGLTMIGMELFFITDYEYRKIRVFIKRNASWFWNKYPPKILKKSSGDDVKGDREVLNV